MIGRTFLFFVFYFCFLVITFVDNSAQMRMIMQSNPIRFYLFIYLLIWIGLSRINIIFHHIFNKLFNIFISWIRPRKHILWRWFRWFERLFFLFAFYFCFYLTWWTMLMNGSKGPYNIIRKLFKIMLVHKVNIRCF